MSGVTLAGGQPSGANTDVGDGGGRALKLQTDTPHLVSMGGDRLSTSVTLHPLPPGRVTLGSGSGVDIPVQGTGVSPLHCHIENSEGVVTLYPLSDNLSIDGLKVLGPTRLSQGVMLTIGRSNYLRFNHPAEAKLMKSVLPNPRISMAPITFEPADMNYRESKLNKKPPVVPRKSPRESLSDSGSEDPPSSIMTKVSKFEYLAAQNLKKSYSPKVFTSNVPTMNVPVKDVLGKDIDSLSLRKSLPQSAVNYVELNTNEKQQNKMPGQTIFSKQKQPAYVNVTVNETRNINNRVIIYENGCIPKSSNVNFDHNDLNNKTATKNVNVSRANAPSPSLSRNNPAQFYRSVTPSPISNNMKIEHRRSGSVGELPANYVEDLDSLASRKHEAEIRRNQAQRDRIKEQELEKAEKQRLEEILNMCAEYERQCQTQGEKSKPPTPNRIITNGSLPRDKRLLGSPFGSPPPSPLEILHNELLKQSNHNYENVPMNFHNPESSLRGPYENVELRKATKDADCGYENVSLQATGSYPSSPRTRIKTFVAANKDGNFKSVEDSIDSKFAVFETERKLIKEAERVLRQNLHNSKEITDDNLDLGHLEPRKSTPTKFIYPMEGEENSANDRQSSESRMSLDSTKKGEESATADSVSFESSQEYNRRLSASQSPEERKRWEQLRKEKRDILAVISRIRRQMNEIEIQEEELHREIELEKALINGEFKSKELELEKMEAKKQKLQKRAQRIEDNMRDCQIKQEEDQEECKKKLQFAQDAMDTMEEKLKATEKTSSDYEAVFEEYLQAQEQLDNERKNFEDLEFHHLEEEADWLASREELQREISDLSNRIGHVKGNLNDLDSQKQKTSKTNSNEYKTIEKQKLECMVRLEEIRDRLKSIDTELMFSNQESDQEVSSESDDSDKSKERPQSTTAPKLTNMSCSMIVSNHSSSQFSEYNMSQSFNEKLMHETSILEDGMAKKFPSQDDIDRISKVTSDAPIIEEGRQSLGRKAIESLKEIERNRHLHLCQQGSQVIEQERQRVLALKQRVQEEVKSQWAQQRQDSVISSGSDSFRTSGSDPASKPDAQVANGDENRKSREDEVDNSPRPLSEISEMSVEVGGTLGKKRIKPISDKQRPLTRYLPIRGSDLDLRNHIETAGHQVVLCPHVIINSNTCRGFLHKKGSKLNGWSRRWFVFDRNKHTLTYYTDKSEKKARGGAYFQAIEEVYLDHLNTVKSPNPQLTFIVKTHERLYHLMAPSPEAMRIWVDVIFTGAEGYREFEHGT